jgi:hypothetical protein
MEICVGPRRDNPHGGSYVCVVYGSEAFTCHAPEHREGTAWR